MKPMKTTLGVIITLTLALLLSFTLATPIALADDGDFDPTFGVDGLVTTDLENTDDTAFDMALQPDGKLVAVGTTAISGNGADFSAVRYNSDGSEDTTFSLDGHVITTLSSGSDLALAVAIQPNGKILAVGYCGAGSLSFYAMVRYNSDGSLDTTFGNGTGKICGTLAITLTGVAVQPDGKIVASGYDTDTAVFDFVALRFNADGTFDTTFGDQGRVVIFMMGNSDSAYDIALQPDGKILVAGTAQFVGSDYDMALARLDPDGELDDSFGESGIVIVNYEAGDDAAHALALTPNGQIYIAGAFFSAANGYDFGLARFDSNGDRDNSFGVNGKVDIPIGSGTDQEVALDMVLQPDGKVVAAGYTPAPGELVFAVVRVLPDGTLDSTFGTGGKVFHHFTNSNESIARSIVIQSDGKLIAGGNAIIRSPQNNDYALARYLSDSSTGPTPTSTSVATATRTNTPPPGSTNTSTSTPSATSTLPPNVTPTICTISFTDVSQGSTFYDFVTCIYCQGIIGGYETGCETGNPCFRPNNNLTRGQLAKIVSNAAAFSENFSTNTFEDVVVGSTFHLFVERLASRAIIGGYACGGAGEPCGSGNKPYFRPNANVTRGQTSKIVAIARNLPAPSPTQRTFEDVPTTQTFWQWIEALSTAGAINGYLCGGPGEPCGGGNLPYFRPSNNVTRGQSSKIITLAFFPSCAEQSRPGK